MSKYLYGASVQGIQGYIFETNRLKEIVGASKIIKDLENINFDELNIKNKPEVILNAAGNLRAIFDNEQDLKNMVKTYPKNVSQNAYGITISQAVVEYKDYKTSSSELEKKLKTQRNKVQIPLDFSFSILKQNPRTAKPLVEKKKEKNKEVFYDISSIQKVHKFEEISKKEVAKNLSNNNQKPIFEIEKLSNLKNKIAVIHADGNGLGRLVKDMDKDKMVQFSKDLDRATKIAKNSATEKIKNKYDKFKERTVILGGDDLTLICDATYALEFTKYFLEEFENETIEIVKGVSNLTACAGIAYANEKYPLHYAVDLAEALCSYAKKDSKDEDDKIPPSSLMFHNIQSANVKSFSKFIDDELTLGSDEKIKCNFGAYYLKEEFKNKSQKPLITDLINTIKDFRKDDNPAGRLREWLSTLDINRTYADNELRRINEITNWKSDNLSKLYSNLSLEKLIVTKDNEEKTPVYDILQILSVEDIK